MARLLWWLGNAFAEMFTRCSCFWNGQENPFLLPSANKCLTDREAELAHLNGYRECRLGNKPKKKKMTQMRTEAFIMCLLWQEVSHHHLGLAESQRQAGEQEGFIVKNKKALGVP